MPRSSRASRAHTARPSSSRGPIARRRVTVLRAEAVAGVHPGNLVAVAEEVAHLAEIPAAVATPVAATAADIDRFLRERQFLPLGPVPIQRGPGHFFLVRRLR